MSRMELGAGHGLPPDAVRACRTETAFALAGALAVGTVLGTLSMLVQGWLPGSSRVFANSGAVWAVVTFAMTLRMRSRRTAMLGGALALLAASVSYYVTANWYVGWPFSLKLPVWSLAGIVAGAALGRAGFIARRSARHRALAWALVAGGVFGEGVHLTWFAGDEQLRPVGLAEIGLAAFIALACTRGRTTTKPVTAIVSVTALATLLAFSVIGRALSAG